MPKHHGPWNVQPNATLGASVVRNAKHDHVATVYRATAAKLVGKAPELVEALEAAVAFVELYTGNGTRKQPPAWAIKPNGEFDAEAIAARARELLGEVA
jgi:hypothetical protein